MAKKPSFQNYWDSIGTGDVPFHGYRDSVIDAPSAVANFEYLLGALRSKAPGQWSQNLLELSRHFTSAAFVAINTLANQTGSCEKRVLQYTPDPTDGDLELQHDEEICRLLEDPNDDDSWFDFAYQISQQLSMTGISLIWKPAYYEDQTPTELYVLPSSSCLPWPPSPVYPHGSYLVQPYYPYGPFSTVPSYQSAAGARIPAEQVIRIKNPHPILRYDGYAVLTAIQRQVDTVDGIDLARWTTQQKGVDPTLTLTFDPEIYNGQIQDFKRLRTQLEALYAGPQNAGRFMAVPPGVTANKFSNTPAEMAWTEGWQQLVQFTMAAYGVPMPVAGMTDAATYATLYASLKQFALIALNPHLKRISSKLNKDLVRKYFSRDQYLELKAQKVNDEDLEIKKFTVAMNAPILKRDEYRKWLDLSPLGGSKGDELVTSKASPTPPKQENEAPLADPDVEATRPDNPEGEDSSGPRSKRLRTKDRLATLLDDMKHRGIAHPSTNGKH